MEEEAAGRGLSSLPLFGLVQDTTTVAAPEGGLGRAMAVPELGLEGLQAGVCYTRLG